MNKLSFIFFLSVLFCFSCSISAQTMDINQLEQLAEDGNANAIEQLGECYYKGFLVEKNFRKAYELFKTAAEKEQSKAMFYLFQCYTFGRGIEADSEKALLWLKRAAIAGDEDAFIEYTTRYPDSEEDILDLQNKWREEHEEKRNVTFMVNGVSFTMVFVEGGNFIMGSDTFSQEEKPAHEVKVDSYMIGQTEVTQALWAAVMGHNPSLFYKSRFHSDTLPVEFVSWEDCQQFIFKLNSLTGQHFRLPTEAEWEFAARGGNMSKGYRYSGSNDIDSIAWYWRNSGKKYLKGSEYMDERRFLTKIQNNKCQTHPVAQKKPNELGIYDMSGNVSEWTQDCFDYYKSAYIINRRDTSEKKCSYRVRRGGSWDDVADVCRVSSRNGRTPESTRSFLGLRLAL